MKIRFGSAQRRDELAQLASSEQAWVIPERLASEEDAVMLIWYFEFEPWDILGWITNNSNRLTPDFSRNIMPYFREAISILEMEFPRIRRAVEAVNSLQFGPEAYQTRQAWRLLARASGLQDRSFWDPIIGGHVDSFESDDEAYIAFPDRTIVEVFGTAAELDPRFNHVYRPGTIIYKVQE